MAEESEGINALAGLANLWTIPEITGAWYNGKEVKLDGFKFVNCRFDNCTLTLSSNNIELDHCIIDDDSIILYSGDVLKPLRLWNRNTKWIYDNVPTFAPTKNDDGTITI